MKIKVQSEIELEISKEEHFWKKKKIRYSMIKEIRYLIEWEHLN